MHFVILLIAGFFILYALTNIRASRVIYIKKLALPFICIVFILCLIIFSKTAVNSASKGISLWLNIVFPSLFPFFVASEFLNKTGFVKAVGILLEPVMRPLFNVPGCGSFALAFGITSGYPVGARITTSMREEKLLTKTEAERLLAFTNNSGPLFIVGAVAVGMFKMPRLGLFLLGCHIAACITVGIIFGFYGRKEKREKMRDSGSILKRFKRELITSNSSAQNLGSIFGDAVKNSITLMLAIGGFIIFFSVIISLLLETGIIHYISTVMAIPLKPLDIHPDIMSALVSGFFEITTGTSMAVSTQNTHMLQQLAAASMIMGWAGLSVHSQVLSIVSKTDISIKPYLLGKFLQGVIAAIYTIAAIKIAGTSIFEEKPAFSQFYSPITLNWQEHLLSSCQNILISLTVLALLIILSISISVIARKSSGG